MKHPSLNFLQKRVQTPQRYLYVPKFHNEAGYLPTMAYFKKLESQTGAYLIQKTECYHPFEYFTPEQLFSIASNRAVCDAFLDL